MKNKPIITVVVSIYNMGQYVERAVDCLLRQDYDQYEIILVNDGSTDNSAEICENLAQKNEIISVLHKENGGLSSARNAGMEAAKGDFVIFPDPDDWTDSNYLSNLIALHDKYNTDLEISGHYVTDDNNEIIHNANASECVVMGEKSLSMLMSSNFFCGFAWNKLYHLDIIRKADLKFDTELGMAQDLHFAVSYFMNCEKIAYNPAPTYHYFQHAGGVTNTAMLLTPRKISGLQTYLKIADITKEKYPDISSKAYATLCNMCVHFMYIYYNSKMDSPEILEVLKGYIRQYKKCFSDSNSYGKIHRLLFRIALISPRLYFIVKRTGQKVKGT